MPQLHAFDQPHVQSPPLDLKGADHLRGEFVRRLSPFRGESKSQSYPPLALNPRMGFLKSLKSSLIFNNTSSTSATNSASITQNSEPITPSSSKSTSSYWQGSPQQPLSSSATSFRSSNSNDSATSAASQIRYPVTILPSRDSPETSSKQPLDTIKEDGYRLATFPTVLDTAWCRLFPGITIRTIERAAAAQIYIELFYAKIYKDNVAISEDRHQSSPYEHQRAHRGEPCPTNTALWPTWTSYNRNELRRTRLQMARMLQDKRQTMQSLDAFELIRVLGRGSFGVVRLVRLKDENHHSCKLGPDWCSASTRYTVSGRDANSLLQCCDRSKRPVFALKAIRKSAMLRNAQEGHIRAERDFLVQAENSQWVVPLIASFQDKHNLYLVLKYMVGGDFLAYLVREDVLDEKDAAFWLAEIILCIEETHSLGWIHRDVKPDNFLLGSDGHLRIADYGLSFNGHWTHEQSYYNNKRHGISRRTLVTVTGDQQDVEEDRNRAFYGSPAKSGHTSRYEGPMLLQHSGRKSYNTLYPPTETPLLHTLESRSRHRLAASVVGTSQYMAPEVLRGELYDGRCDWWSVGIILYECLFGVTPFYNDNRQKTKEAIVNHEECLRFPTTPRYNKPTDPDPNMTRKLPLVSDRAIDLISQLVTDKEDRLCCAAYKANDLELVRCGVIHERRHIRKGSFPMASSSTTEDHAPQLVWPDDAADLKKHPFFIMHGIDFDLIHQTVPPWIPSTHGDAASTQYFENELSIVQHDNVSLKSNQSSSEPKPSKLTLFAVGNDKGASSNGHLFAAASSFQAQVPAQVDDRDKTKRRPRDKILRDPVHAKEAMRHRKKLAFLGYSWRRPDTWRPSIDLLGDDSVETAGPLGKRCRPALPVCFMGCADIET